MPGNHDRLNDNVAGVLSRGAWWVRECCEARLRLVCIDSTQDVNATLIMANGDLSIDTAEAAAKAAKERREGQSVLVLIHHHLVKASVEDFLELFSEVSRLPFAGCLKRGQYLAKQLAGHAAAVLHGHKHKAAVVHFRDEAGTVLPVINAGSTTESMKYRILDVDENAVLDERWVGF